MDAQTCLKKLSYVGVLAFATVDETGGPQVRNISAIHYEPDALYFFTARGKDFCRELLASPKVQVLGYTMYKEMIRLSGTAEPVPDAEQAAWRDRIFAEQPYLANVYPGATRQIGIVFRIRDGHRIFQPGGQPHLPPELHHRRGPDKAQRLPRHRRLHRLQAVCGPLPPGVHRRHPKAGGHPAGALPALRRLF